MKPISYNAWFERESAHLVEQDTKVDCVQCDGNAYIWDEEMEDDSICDDCDERGKVQFKNLGEIDRSTVLSPRVYVKVSMKEITQLCAYAQKDFFLMAGKFMSGVRTDPRIKRWVK